MIIRLNNCRLIPELSNACSFEYADVLIKDGLILNVLPANSKMDSEESQSINCNRKTLIPGMFDLHMHLDYTWMTDEPRLSDFKLFTMASLTVKRYLDFGFTTVRDMGAPKRVSIAVRTAINKGLFNGPRIISGGMIINPISRASKREEFSFMREVSGSDEMIKAAREEIGEGADYIKLYVNGNPPSMLPEEIDAAVRIAKINKKKVAAHAHDTQAINMCIDKGVDTIEHGSYIDAEAIEKLKEEKSYLVPTLAILSPLTYCPGINMNAKETVLKNILDANAVNITAAYKAGLKLGFGTDTPIESFEGYEGLEFKMRKEICGMSNIDILLQATKYSALILGLQNVTGEIKEGLAADLVLVDGNPDENIEVMYKKPLMVFKAGILN